MTLEAYDPLKLDALALRVLDVACNLREIAALSNEHDLTGLQLHDKKALEMLTKLDEWSHEALVRCQTAALKQRATRRALGLHEERDPSTTGARKKRR